jgi:hypothetical protein
LEHDEVLVERDKYDIALLEHDEVLVERDEYDIALLEHVKCWWNETRENVGAQ